MKKTLALLLALVMVLSLCACGEGKSETIAPNTEDPQETVHTVGEEIETEYYRFTLKSAELTKNILVCNGDKADKATFTKAEEFFTPSDSPFKDENGNLIEGVHGFSVSQSSEKVYLYYALEFEYIGKEERSVADYDFNPIVNYKDYTFGSDYFSFYRTVKGTDISKWNNYNSDSNIVSTVKALGLEVGYFSGKVEPLSSTVYEIRGIIPIPTAAAEDIEESLFLQLAGITIKVR